MRKSRKNKILALILTVVMVLGMLPGTAFADETATQDVVDAATEAGELVLEQEAIPITGTEVSGTESVPDQSDESISDATTEADEDSRDGTAEEIPDEEGAPSETDAEAETLALTPMEALETPLEPIGNGEPSLVDLVGIDAITDTVLKVLPAGENDWLELPLPDGVEMHVGDQVHIKFNYKKLEGVTPDTVYFITIPKGLSAITGDSRGPIMDGTTKIGEYWVDGDKIKLQFTNETYLDESDNEITAGFVNFYSRLNSDAIDEQGVIKLGETILGTVPIVPDADVVNVKLNKWNGDGSVPDSDLIYDPVRNAVQYTFQVNTNGNNKTIDQITVTDTLTTSVNGNEDPSIVTGDYTGINIDPAGAATFTRGQDGKYILTAKNVAPDKTIKVTYWVPVKSGIVQARFVNDVEAARTMGGTTTVVDNDSVQGNIANQLQVNKSASAPAFDPDTATTTVTYTVKVTAPGTNTTPIANAFVEDTFKIHGEFVKSVQKTSGDGTFGSLTTGENAHFKVDLGTMAPDTTKTYTYVATLDSNLCYFYNTPDFKWFDNWAEAKAGDLTFDKSKASLKFEKQFTDKSGTFDPTTGLYRFVLEFDGTIPGTSNQYYDKVLKSFHDEITSNNATYVSDPAPKLEALKGSVVQMSRDLDGSQINGQTSFDLAVPLDMQGPYNYRLTYYVDMPEGLSQTDQVKNKFSATIGVGPGGQDITFQSESSVSAGSAASNAMSKWVDVEGGTNGIAGNNDYGVTKFGISIYSPIIAGAELTDWTEKTPGAMVDFKMPVDFIRQNMTIKYNGGNLEEDVDYKIEAAGDTDEKFMITFLKAIPGVTETNPVTIEYLAQDVVSEAGEAMAENPGGGKTGNQKELYNYVQLKNGALTTDKKTKVDMGGYVEKKVVDKTGMGVGGDLVGWDVVITNGYFDAFGTGYHPLVDKIPADQELVKIEHFLDNRTPEECGTDPNANHGYSAVVNDDGTTTVTINAFTGYRNHPQTYRIWTRIKDSYLIANNIDPDNFEDLPVSNSAYYEAVGTKWNVSADTTVSRKNNDKTFKYDAGTEMQSGGVEFTLIINAEGLDMDAVDDIITVQDTMNRALTLKKETLRLNGLTVEQVPGASLHYDEGSNQFTLELPDKTPFVITYTAEIDAEVDEAGWLTNEAYVEGRYGTVTTSSVETKRVSIVAGSSSTLTFYLKKTDKDGKRLSEGQFQFRKVELKDGQLTETVVSTPSNQNGMFYDFGDGTYKYRGVEKGVIYVVKELTPPAGCEARADRYVYFGEPDPAVLQALIDAGADVTQGHTGGATKVDTMFELINDDALIDIPVTKKWDDKSDLDQLRPSSITVKLKADGEVIKTQVLTPGINTLPNSNNNAWGCIFTDLPTHKTLDNTKRQEIVYEVEEETVPNYDTPVIVKDQTGNGYTITNTHQAITPAEQEFTGTKTLMEGTTPLTITEGQFKFSVEADAGNPDTIEGLPTGEISVGADGTFSLGTLKFKKAGTYKFTVSEVNGGVAGYTYDNKPVTVTVPVTLDTTDNTLVIGTVTYQKDSQPATGIEFKNTYTTPSGATKVFSGVKTLKENNVGINITAGQFKFTVAAGDGNPAAIGGLPTGEISVLADGTFSLGTLSFPQAGTYTFTVSEVNGGATGYTYDPNPVKVTVPVTLNAASNTLEIGTVTYEKNSQGVNGIEFENTYTTPGGADKTFTGSKSLKENGNDKDIAAGQFKFVAQEDENNPAAITGFPEGEMSVNADGTFSLGTLSFPQAGTYTFTVSEVNGGAAGYTYDDKPVKVTVPVTLNTENNTLVIGDVTYEKDSEPAEGISFENTYTTPDPVEQGFAGTKTLKENGEDKAIKDGQFKFVIQAGENNPARVDLPTEAIPVREDGSFEIGNLSFAKAGTYTFIVSEENGGAAGYTYDDKDVTVTVRVDLNEADNTLSVAEINYSKDGVVDTGITFNNTYTTPDPANAVVTGNKKLTENGAAKAVKAGQFKFTVASGENNPADITGLPTGEIAVNADGTFSLGTLSFTKAGDYSFNVSEVNGGEKGYTYDDKPVTVGISVELNEETNKLEVAQMVYIKDGKGVSGIEFINTYTPDPVKPSQPSGKNTGTKGGYTPKTGDAANIIVWAMLLAMSGVGIAGLYLMRRRKNKSSK